MSLVLLPRHPLHMWKYHVTLYHFPFRAPLTRASDSDLQLSKQLAPAFFFFLLLTLLLRSWTCGPGWSAAQPATTGCFLLEAELSVCFHCVESDGGYLSLPLSGASGMRAEEKLPSAHNRLASTPRAKTSQLEDLGFQPQLFFS